MNRSNAHLYLPLVKALSEGKTVQLYTSDRWADIFPNYEIDFHLGPESYRVKPDMLEYRRYVGKCFADNSLHVGICTRKSDVDSSERSITFVRWIDTEWQEVEA